MVSRVLWARREAYGLFELVAWPALVWSAAELLLRLLVLDAAGLAAPVLIMAASSATVIACRSRKAGLPGGP